MGFSNGGGGGGGILSGTLANRPASSSTNGYFATDTGQLFVPNGAGGWTEITYISQSLSVGPLQGIAFGAGAGNGVQLGVAPSSTGVGRDGGPLGLWGAQVKFETAGAASATAGAATLPANPVGFFIAMDSSGTARKIPYYAT